MRLQGHYTPREMTPFLFTCRVAEAQAPSPYPPPPWVQELGLQYLWYAIPYPSVTSADDAFPDPNVNYLGLTTVVLVRYTSGDVGPYDALFTSSFVRVKNGTPVIRAMRAYTSRVVDELQYPFKLARFEWKQQVSGGQNVRVFSPKNATTPLAEFTGIFTLPFSVPISNTSVFDPLLKDLLSTVQTVKNPSTGEITSRYVRDAFWYSSQATLVAFTTLSSPSGEMDPFFKGVIPVGLAFLGGPSGLNVEPYIPTN
eukprot:jgi/Botrbrau1/11227/Bobra.0075s0023.2